MRVIKIRRIIKSQSRNRRPFRNFARDFLANENIIEFAMEAAAFGALLAISAWPILAVADAINRLR